MDIFVFMSRVRGGSMQINCSSNLTRATCITWSNHCHCNCQVSLSQSHIIGSSILAPVECILCRINKTAKGGNG